MTHDHVALAFGALTLLAAFSAPLRAKEQPLPADLPPYGADKPLPAPKIEEQRLANGLTVWLVPRAGFPKVTLLLVVRGGTAADPLGMGGMADVLAATLKEGSARRSSQQIAIEAQAVGGTLQVGADDDAVTVTADGLASGMGTLIDLVADVALHPTFPDKEVELARTNALQGLMAREATPEFAVQKAFAAAVYGEHPYRIVAPTREILERVTPTLLRDEHRRRFRPERALLLIVGAFDPAAVAKQARTLFGGWKASGQPPAATPATPPAGARRILVVDRPGSVQSEIRAGRPTVKATDPDYHALLVANTIFGGAFPSRLIENIREDKGYTYSPRSTVFARQEGGLLAVRAPVRTAVTAGALLEIFYELDRMAATDVTPDELERSTRYQAGLYLLRNQTQGALAGTLAQYWVNGLPPAALAEFVGKIKAVTMAQVREVGKKLMTSDSQTVVIGGDAKQIESDVAIFGEVKRVQP
jgi:zinc protease